MAEEIKEEELKQEEGKGEGEGRRRGQLEKESQGREEERREERDFSGESHKADPMAICLCINSNRKTVCATSIFRNSQVSSQTNSDSALETTRLPVYSICSPIWNTTYASRAE